MAYKPILFNTEMVKSILEGRKTQTRRIIKPQPTNPRWNFIGWLGWDDGHGRRMKAPCDPGDILWVRETWKQATADPAGGGAALENIILYKADVPQDYSGMLVEEKWHPSIHMPKEAARIFLRVKTVRVERLNDIGDADAIFEGCSGTPCEHEYADPVLGCTDCLNTGWLEPPFAEFAQLWDTTIKPADISEHGWNANPWVWVIEFERCKKPKEW